MPHASRVNGNSDCRSLIAIRAAPRPSEDRFPRVKWITPPSTNPELDSRRDSTLTIGKQMRRLPMVRVLAGIDCCHLPSFHIHFAWNLKLGPSEQVGFLREAAQAASLPLQHHDSVGLPRHDLAHNRVKSPEVVVSRLLAHEAGRSKLLIQQVGAHIDRLDEIRVC